MHKPPTASILLYHMGMKHAPSVRSFTALIITLAITLAGCTTPQRGIPTAVIYDQDQDTFTVEVDPLAQDAAPVYRDTLELFTIIDGQKHTGLIPAAVHRVPDDRGLTKIWNGPGSVRYIDSKWRTTGWEIFLPRVESADTPLKIQVYRRYEYSPPIYSFRIDGAQYRVD